MKKYSLILFALISMIFVISCNGSQVTDNDDDKSIGEPTIDCIPGYMWSNDLQKCILSPDANIVESKTYIVQFEGEDYTVYRTYDYIDDKTNISVDMGDYGGYNYYFASSSDYYYYLVEKDGEYLRLDQAIEEGWFSLEKLVEEFNISHLQRDLIE